MTDVTASDIPLTAPDLPAPPFPGEETGPPPSDVPDALPGRPDPFTGRSA